MSSTCLASAPVLPQLLSYLSTALALACESNQPKSLEAATNSSTSPEGFWCLTFYAIPINAAQLCKADQSCMKEFIVCPFTCLLQQNIPSPVSAPAKCSFKCWPQQNTIQMTFQRTLKFPLQELTRQRQFLSYGPGAMSADMELVVWYDALACNRQLLFIYLNHKICAHVS